MRSIIGLVAVLGLASGLIGAFAVSQLSGQAGAAPSLVMRQAEVTLPGTARDELSDPSPAGHLSRIVWVHQDRCDQVPR